MPETDQPQSLPNDFLPIQMEEEIPFTPSCPFLSSCLTNIGTFPTTVPNSVQGCAVREGRISPVLLQGL